MVVNCQTIRERKKGHRENHSMGRAAMEWMRKEETLTPSF